MIAHPEDTGVANPYSLAELVLGKKIAWRKIRNSKKYLESILGMPFDRIIHPNSGSPIFRAFRRAWKIPVSGRYSVPAVKRPAANGKKSSIKKIPVSILSLISSDKDGDTTVQISDAWEPENGSWGGSGYFFHETAEFSDPVQGVVADCYLIAAQASTAWARPFALCHRTRATGTAQSAFVNMLEFHGEDGTTAQVEVTCLVPVSDATGSFICSRSSEVKELWPGILEKAYAKWRTGHKGDKPNIPFLAGGSPFKAIMHLSGLPEWHYSTNDYTADELWNMVRENSKSRKTLNPMAAGTTSEKLLQEQGSTYIGTGIVPGHAYSILGWDRRDGKKYLILRNPWGFQEPVVGSEMGSVSLYDISWWQNIELASPDGVFGIEAEVFKTYFSYIGGGKE